MEIFNNNEMEPTGNTIPCTTFLTLEGSSTGIFPLADESLEMDDEGVSDVAAESSVEENRRNEAFL
jgi:hypothetical protein